MQDEGDTGHVVGSDKGSRGTDETLESGSVERVEERMRAREIQYGYMTQ